MFEVWTGLKNPTERRRRRQSARFLAKRDQGNGCSFYDLPKTSNGSEATGSFVWARANELRASVWSAWSLLPLFFKQWPAMQAVKKRRQAGRSPHASRDCARVDGWRASVWSAWSLLPLFFKLRPATRAVRKRRQAGRTPNASRRSTVLAESGSLRRARRGRRPSGAWPSAPKWRAPGRLPLPSSRRNIGA